MNKLLRKVIWVSMMASILLMPQQKKTAIAK